MTSLWELLQQYPRAHNEYKLGAWEHEAHILATGTVQSQRTVLPPPPPLPFSSPSPLPPPPPPGVRTRLRITVEPTPLQMQLPQSIAEGASCLHLPCSLCSNSVLSLSAAQCMCYWKKKQYATVRVLISWKDQVPSRSC